jgi:hypothetical protein
MATTFNPQVCDAIHQQYLAQQKVNGTDRANVFLIDMFFSVTDPSTDIKPNLDVLLQMNNQHHYFRPHQLVIALSCKLCNVYRKTFSRPTQEQTHIQNMYLIDLYWSNLQVSTDNPFFEVLSKIRFYIKTLTHKIPNISITKLFESVDHTHTTWTPVTEDWIINYINQIMKQAYSANIMTKSCICPIVRSSYAEVRTAIQADSVLQLDQLMCLSTQSESNSFEDNFGLLKSLSQ